MKIVFLDKINLEEKHLQEINQLVELSEFDDLPSKEIIIARIKNAEVAVANWIRIDSEIIDSASKLQAIIVPAAGYDLIDIKYARSKNIDVINCPTYNSWAVAELTLGLMYAVSRKITQANIGLIKGKWKQNEMIGTELNHKKVLLIGHGNIGTKTHGLLNAIGMEVTIANSKISNNDLDKQISLADYIVLNVPLNPATHHLIDARRLQLMKPTAFLINTSRGAVIDQLALIKTLTNKKIAGAALDVFENEPKSAKITAEMKSLVKLPNVITTPHIGFNTKESITRLGLELIKNITAIINQQPINIVN